MRPADIIQTNFTAGELSLRMMGRVDVERYKNGVAKLENFKPLIHGGAKTMELIRYNASTKNNNRLSILFGFKFSKTEANLLEIGHNYIRFFNADRTPVMSGGVPYEIATVYDESELRELEFESAADTILIFHQAHPVQRLRRFANDYWVIDNAPFDPQPFAELGHEPAAGLALGSLSVGAGVVTTADASAFVSADVGRRIVSGGGVGLITGYTSATQVVITIETAFSAIAIDAGNWSVEGSPQAVCTPSKAGSIGEAISLTLTTGTLFGAAQSISLASFESSEAPPEIHFTTITSHGLSSGQTVQIRDCVPFEYNGTYEVVDILNGVTFAVNYAPNPGALQTPGVMELLQSSSVAGGWRPEDVGSFVKINGGLVEITAYTSASQVTGIVRQEMTSAVGAQAGAWTLNQTIWNDDNGYPRTGAFFDQRLFVGGSPAYPHTVIASVIGEYYNFELGVEDDRGFMHDLNVYQYDPILHISRNKRQLIVQTSGNEYALTGGIEKPMTPTNVQVEDPTDWGCNDVKPVRVGNELIFVNYTGLKLRALGYRFESDGFTSPDLTKLSEHITAPGIVSMAYQKEPESIIWCVRSDGVLVALAIDREEGVLSWARQLTDGEYESVAVIPNHVGVDEVWFVVKRTIAGSTVRYIESLDTAVNYSLQCAISGSGPVSTITGLAHLNGKAVMVVAEGVVKGPYTVSGGAITLDREVMGAYYVGLFQGGYLKTLNPELVTQMGSIQGNSSRQGKITLRMLDSTAVKIGGQYVDKRRFGDSLLDEPPPPFTGDIDVTSLGWKENGFIEVEQPNPLPAHLLAIISKLTVNNG